MPGPRCPLILLPEPAAAPLRLRARQPNQTGHAHTSVPRCSIARELITLSEPRASGTAAPASVCKDGAAGSRHNMSAACCQCHAN